MTTTFVVHDGDDGQATATWPYVVVVALGVRGR
jgi:hypothetical protein